MYIIHKKYFYSKIHKIYIMYFMYMKSYKGDNFPKIKCY